MMTIMFQFRNANILREKSEERHADRVLGQLPAAALVHHGDGRHVLLHLQPQVPDSKQV